MGDSLDLAGTTVTLFGEAEPIDHALSDELGRRGCTTHYVTVPTGWLSSVSHAIVRLDTPSGVLALKQLADSDQPPAHVVAVCAQQTDASVSDRFSELCRVCDAVHDVSLIWHAPLGPTTAGEVDLFPSEPTVPAPDVAALVADEVLEHTHSSGSS